MEKDKSTAYVDMRVEDGVFHMVYKPLDLLTIEIAREIVRERVAFKDGISYPSLFDIREVKSTSKDARDFMANEGNDLVIASALLINSSVTKMIGNFFISVSKPKNPTKIFTDQPKAMEWLDFYMVPQES